MSGCSLPSADSNGGLPSLFLPVAVCRDKQTLESLHADVLSQRHKIFDSFDSGGGAQTVERIWRGFTHMNFGRLLSDSAPEAVAVAEKICSAVSAFVSDAEFLLDRLSKDVQGLQARVYTTAWLVVYRHLMERPRHRILESRYKSKILPYGRIIWHQVMGSELQSVQRTIGYRLEAVRRKGFACALEWFQGRLTLESVHQGLFASGKLPSAVQNDPRDVLALVHLLSQRPCHVIKYVELCRILNDEPKALAERLVLTMLHSNERLQKEKGMWVPLMQHMIELVPNPESLVMLVLETSFGSVLDSHGFCADCHRLAGYVKNLLAGCFAAGLEKNISRANWEEVIWRSYAVVYAKTIRVLGHSAGGRARELVSFFLEPMAAQVQLTRQQVDWLAKQSEVLLYAACIDVDSFARAAALLLQLPGQTAAKRRALKPILDCFGRDSDSSNLAVLHQVLARVKEHVGLSGWEKSERRSLLRWIRRLGGLGALEVEDVSSTVQMLHEYLDEVFDVRLRADSLQALCVRQVQKHISIAVLQDLCRKIKAFRDHSCALYYLTTGDSVNAYLDQARKLRAQFGNQFSQEESVIIQECDALLYNEIRD